MKRFSIIALGALAMLMAGCSKDAPVSPPDENAWIKDVNLPVPVLFGSSSLSATTKADDPGMIEGETLIERTVGVIGIDADATTWKDPGTNSTSVINPDALLLKRTVKTKTNGDIVFENPKEYYPMVSDKSFNFYGYYPDNIGYLSVGTRGNELPGSTTGSQVIFYNCTVGYQDILWAGTTNDDRVFEYGTDDEGNPLTVTGYNAKYIRKIKYAQMDIDADETLSDGEKEAKKAELERYMPQLKFKHCLSAARFFVQAKDDYAAGTFVTEGGEKVLEVTGLTLKGIYNQGSLIVAIRNNNTVDDASEWEGKMVKYGSAQPTDVNLTNPDGTDITTVVPTTATSELGHGLMLIPGSADKTDDNGETYYIEGEVKYNIWTTDEGGNKIAEPNTLAVKFPIKAKTTDENGNEIDNNFAAGKRYTFTVVFNSLEEVTIKTGLTPWVDNDDFVGNEIVGGGEGGEHIEIE